jgi:sodium-dependent dicarboxylate transporter 2/3/5
MSAEFTESPISHKRNKKIGLVLGPTLFLVILLYPTSQGMEDITKSKNLPPLSPQIALGTMTWMIIWWVTESMPLGLTGRLAPFIFVISGILSALQALSTFADPIIWIFISGFILAAALIRELHIFLQCYIKAAILKLRYSSLSVCQHFC